MDVPSSCSSCGTAIPPGYQRCPGCGRVYGDANRCRSCNAFAAVRPTAGGYVCAACGAPRERLPGTVVEGFPAGITPPPQQTQQWMKSVAMGGGAVGLKLVAAGIVGASFVVAGFIGLVAGGTVALIPAGFIGLAGLGVGGLLWSWGSHAGKRAALISSSAQELEILALAEKHAGELYATDVARGLGLSLADAEARLSAMADGTRILADVTPEGLLRFEFRELKARRPAVQARVAEPTAEPAEVDTTTAEERENRR